MIEDATSPPQSRLGAVHRNRSFPIAAALTIAALADLIGTSRAAIPGYPDPIAVKTVEDCLATATSAKTDPSACIGSASRSCIESASTTSEKEACSDRELVVWTDALNRDLPRLTKLLPNEELRRSLREVQHAFLVAELQTCTFERMAHNNSPDSLVAASQCNTRLTARQDLWVREQIRTFSPP